MGNPRRIFYQTLIFLLLLPVLPPLWAQSDTPAGTGETDLSELIGLTLAEVLDRFGAPESVYAVRGVETWQDDVVFMYPDRDLYIYKDRVWQLGVSS
ncbi:MAG: hypothetical protein LBN21_02045, partial [Treponema sp.]|nr:hypothetical protein [Treponema sp.]